MRLYLHIIKAHAGPFIFAFSTLMFIFLLQFIMKFIDQLVGKGLSWWIIGELVALSLAYMVVLAVPMAVLVATLMAYGGMASRNEITAMKACGMSFYRMLAPAFIGSLVITYLLFQFDNRVLPEANHQLKTLTYDIRRIKPTLSIVPGLFSQDIAGYSILAKKTDEYSNDLEGVTIYDYSDPSTNVVVTAERGKVSFTPDYRRLIMDLSTGEIHQLNLREPNLYRRIRFVSHRIIMTTEGFDFERSEETAFSRGGRELSIGAMRYAVDSLERLSESARTVAVRAVEDQVSNRSPFSGGVAADPAAAASYALPHAILAARNLNTTIQNQILLMRYNEEQINTFLVEIDKKYAIPFACLVFIFLGAPLGTMARRGTFGIAATLSLGFFLLYWSCLIGGEKLAVRGLLAPWVGMWIANIILLVVGVYLTIRVGRENPRIRWSAIRRFIPKAWRSPDTDEEDAEVR